MHVIWVGAATDCLHVFIAIFVGTQTNMSTLAIDDVGDGINGHVKLWGVIWKASRQDAIPIIEPVLVEISSSLLSISSKSGMAVTPVEFLQIYQRAHVQLMQTETILCEPFGRHY